MGHAHCPGPGRPGLPVYLDRQLWAFTAGVRARIVGTVLLGLLAVSAGIARLALLGWLLGRVLAGVPAGNPDRARDSSGAGDRPPGCVGLHPDHGRPPHGGARAGAAPPGAATSTSPRWAPPTSRRRARATCILSVVEGVQQLEVYFGQYLPQLFVRALTPVLIFAFVAFDGPADRARPARRRPAHARSRPSALAPLGQRAGASRASEPTPPSAPSSSTRSRGSAR